MYPKSFYIRVLYYNTATATCVSSYHFTRGKQSVPKASICMCPHTSILLTATGVSSTTLLLNRQHLQDVVRPSSSPPCLPPPNLLLIQYVIYYLHPTRPARALHALPEILQECLHLTQGGRCVCEDEKGPPKSSMQKVVCI